MWQFIGTYCQFINRDILRVVRHFHQIIFSHWCVTTGGYMITHVFCLGIAIYHPITTIFYCFKLLMNETCTVRKNLLQLLCLTHRGRVTHIYVNKQTIIGSNNGLSPGRHQAIIWTYAWILLIAPLGTNFTERSSKIHIFSFKKMHFKIRLENGGHFVSASTC